VTYLYSRRNRTSVRDLRADRRGVSPQPKPERKRSSSAPVVDYSSWRINDLRAAAAAHGLPAGGTKAELIERLSGAG